MLQKNAVYTVEIVDYTTEGVGIAKIDGIAVFVPRTAVGDVCEVRITKVAKRYAFGRRESVITPSTDRIQPVCEVADKCGGCCYQHISYEAELQAKQKKVTNALHRLGGAHHLQPEIVGSPTQTAYRNKAQFPVGQDASGAHFGFFRVRSHDIVPMEGCEIQSDAANLVARTVCQWMRDYDIPAYSEKTEQGLIRHVYVRSGEVSGQVHVCIIAAKSKKPPYQQELVERLRKAVPALCGLVWNINNRTDNVILGDRTILLWGNAELIDTLCGNEFALSPHAFYQVNHAQAEALYGCALDYADLQGNELVFDLYCGAGTITLALARIAEKVIGVEVVPEAIVNAKENAKRNGITNVEFLCADAGEAANMLEERGLRPHVITVDPPRKGLDELAIAALVKIAPEKIVYVSCDPATLARDVKLLTAQGYEAVQAKAFDLFPRTHHVETVCLLSKLKSDHHIEVDLNMDELDLTSAESKATYDEIKAYVLEHNGLKVSSLYIAQVKEKLGIKERENYNHAKSEDAKTPQCPPEKEEAIRGALKHFGMIG